jgi:hypothetical protein
VEADKSDFNESLTRVSDSLENCRMFGKSLPAWNIRTKLLLLILLLSLPASGLIIKNGFDQRAHAIQATEEKVLLLVESLAAQQQQITIGDTANAGHFGATAGSAKH